MRHSADRYALFEKVFALNCFGKERKTYTEGRKAYTVIMEMSCAGEGMKKKHELVVWQEDVTHDGTADRIEIDLTEARAEGENLSGKEETIRIYSGKTGEKIWSGHADTIQLGWNGFYLYRNPENGKAYILNWRPVLYQGAGSFFFRIFSLTERGETKPFAEEGFAFDLNTISKAESTRLDGYIARLNGYLNDSYLLIDTDGGKVKYSPEGKLLKKTYKYL